MLQYRDCGLDRSCCWCRQTVRYWQLPAAECCSLKHVHEKYFTCSALRELLENVDATTVIDFIKEVNFYHLVQRSLLLFFHITLAIVMSVAVHTLGWPLATRLSNLRFHASAKLFVLVASLTVCWCTFHCSGGKWSLTTCATREKVLSFLFYIRWASFKLYCAEVWCNFYSPEHSNSQ